MRSQQRLKNKLGLDLARLTAELYNFRFAPDSGAICQLCGADRASFEPTNDLVRTYGLRRNGFGVGGDKVSYKRLRGDYSGSELLVPDHLLYRSDEENPGCCACQCDGCQDRESPVEVPRPVQDESGECRNHNP